MYTHEAQQPHQDPAKKPLVPTNNPKKRPEAEAAHRVLPSHEGYGYVHGRRNPVGAFDLQTASGLGAIEARELTVRSARDTRHGLAPLYKPEVRSWQALLRSSRGVQGISPCSLNGFLLPTIIVPKGLQSTEILLD